MAKKSAARPSAKARKPAKKAAPRAPAKKPVRAPARKPAAPAHRPASANGRPAAPVRKGAHAAAPAAPVKKLKSPFDRAQLHAFREALLGLRSSRIGDKESREKEALKAAGQDVSVDHMADFGSDNYEQEFTLGLLEQDIETLRDINDALVRIKEGAFGLCEECEKPVARPRLKVIPYARLCVDCKMKEE